MSRGLLVDCRCLAAFLALLVALPQAVNAEGKIFEVEYPPAEKEGELVFGVTYRVWIPKDVKKIRGVLVHQHGCGSGACQGGLTAADDLHWQALAKKWDCALFGPSYHQEDKQNCRLWCDPRNGSEKAFLRSLRDLAEKSNHPELETAPWCLWGHSGGAFWASLMQAKYPSRIVAIWFRSGTAFSAWEKGEIAKPEIPDAAYRIPMVCNPGAKENGDARFSGAWTGAMAMFKAYREKDATIAFIPDPRTAHECGDCRYLAIPFFDECLAMRLPEPGSSSQSLKPVDRSKSLLAPLIGETATLATQFQDDPKTASWLPSESFVGKWREYIKVGSTSDASPPPEPYQAKVEIRPDGSATVTWRAEADFESGIQAFVIRRNGEEIGRVPEKAVARFGRPLFQGLSYHDTPDRPLPEMKFLDKSSPTGARYEVISINTAGLKSKPVPGEVVRNSN